MIHVLEMGFTLLNRRVEFLILASTEFAIEDIGKSMVYTTLNISTHKAKSLYNNISGI